MKSVVVYQAYGQPINLKQSLFSILSLLKRDAELSWVETILVYTDNPSFFSDFFKDHPKIKYEDMGPSRVKAWRGAIDFVHRVKVEMLRDVARHYPASNILYMDGDTVFEKSPAPLHDLIHIHHSVMHEAENVVELGRDPLSKKVARFLKKSQFRIRGELMKVSPSTMMWNAGVLGFAPSFFPDLDKVLEFTDQAYLKYQKHIMEQLAFSYFLAVTSRIHSAQSFVHHYWRQKDEYNEMISKFIEDHPHLDAAFLPYDQIQWPAPPQPKRSFLKKVVSQLFG